jgi:hypothetical protein
MDGRLKMGYVWRWEMDVKVNEEILLLSLTPLKQGVNIIFI